MTMTLADVRDWHRGCEQAAMADGYDNARDAHKELADALDAHIAAMGEPAAWSLDFGTAYGINAATTYKTLEEAEAYADMCAIPDVCDPNPIRPGIVPLYLAPPAPGDWDEVRAVIARHRSEAKMLAHDPESRAYLTEMADKLTAALPENAK